MRTLAFVHVDRLILAALGETAPSDLEWRSFVVLVKHQGKGMSHLISTAGGEPTNPQRKQLDAVLAEGGVHAAIVTEVKRIRVEVNAWPGNRIEAFAPHDIDEALYFLRVPVPRRDFVRGKLGALREQVGDGAGPGGGVAA